MVLAYQKHSLSKFLFKEKLSPVCPSFEKEKGDQKGGGLIEKNLNLEIGANWDKNFSSST